MLMLNARCVHCNFEGELELLRAHDRHSELGMFRYLGQNPLTGYVYYRCPDCDMILRVDPLDIFDESFIINVCDDAEMIGSLRTSYVEAAVH